MGLLDKTSGALGKAASKTASVISNNAVKVGNITKDKIGDLLQKNKEGENYLYNLVLKQRPNMVRDKFKVYDEEGKVIYKAKRNLLSPAWVLTITDFNGDRLASLRKKVFSARSPLKRTEGKNVEFEFEIEGNKLGGLRNKELGSVFDGIGKRMEDFKQSFKGRRFECDFADLEIIETGLYFRYEICTRDGIVLAKSKKSFWSYGDCYKISHSSKKDELLFLMLILAMDFLNDERSLKEKMRQSWVLGSTERDY